MNPNPNNPLGALTRLQHRLADEALKVGLKLVTFAVIPSPNEDGHHTAQAVFVECEKPPEPADPQMAAELEAIEEATRLAEQEKRAEKARDDLRKLADETTPFASDDRPMGPRSRGIGLDD